MNFHLLKIKTILIIEVMITILLAILIKYYPDFETDFCVYSAIIYFILTVNIIFKKKTNKQYLILILAYILIEIFADKALPRYEDTILGIGSVIIIPLGMFFFPVLATGGIDGVYSTMDDEEDDN
jgi:hypothetical protein